MNASQKDIDDFCDQKMVASMEILADWIAIHPQATPEEASEELFQILMGKRVQ